jgi:hypothetical protein
MDDELLLSVKKNIVKINRFISKKNGDVGSNKIVALSKLLNSYNRILKASPVEAEKKTDCYYDKVEAGTIRMLGK